MLRGDLTELKGIGDKTKQVFTSAGINSIGDLLNYFPRDYHDHSKITKITDSMPGIVTLSAHIDKVKSRYVRRGMHITEAVATDDSGSIKLVWFNQPYRKDSLSANEVYYITGKLEFSSGHYSIVNPSIELSSSAPVHTARIVPIYRETKNLNNKLIRKAMHDAIGYSKNLSELLPQEMLSKYGLMSREETIKNLHFPKDTESLSRAKHTMSLMELFELMLASKILKSQISSQLAPVIGFKEKLAKQFVDSLDFKLTDAQRRVMWHILQDIDSNKPMNRLVEGDVGSGKTIVAAMAMIMTVKSNYQVAYLAPTEILARQHFETITKTLSNLPSLKLDDSTELLVGSMTTSSKKSIRDRMKNGDIKIIIGTHALLHKLPTSNLGLIIIDEQHRFGVDQRNELLKQNKLVPHILSMTATPIPRSLALTLYGELDISLLDAMPPGRKPIITELVSPNSRQRLHDHIEAELNKGHQVYVVCPLIDQGSKIKSASAELTYKRLSTDTFKHRKVALLHGKLKSVEKNHIMKDFTEGRVDILVSTTVIEVGVNVPNATMMIIEGAERFGLAQMHQLRGRVGRSSDQAYCYIVPSDSQAPSKRLRAFTRVIDGFKLAELDLEIRGPGAIYGTMQHGSLDLRFANLSDHRLIAQARQAVSYFYQKYNLDDYPELKRRIRLAQAIVTLN